VRVSLENILEIIFAAFFGAVSEKSRDDGLA
jgi:hypothetical protein